ncbi:hypothetical protein H7A76_30345 [Pseudomonas sp. MSSRFD41]|uniref:hypothetical protein n=1 Tax=Pseudomonas sp. MSSRFD41 TaxID=1310370 RepID=UPI00163B1388|nr:hypothetical protein [Pseudomonas sp. MSSRFD41]MBC2659755.1 hypothetical protein [Pseudomonas sp. MSSRFD41]
MKISRIEVDVISGKVIEIGQVAYKNDSGDIFVLDDNVSAPEGLFQFDPEISQD